MQNLNQSSPKASNTVIQRIKQAKLVMWIEPHYSYVALSTHMFDAVYI